METYELKKEFLPKYNISLYQWDRRKADLLVWLSNFFDYEILDGQPVRIQINEIFGDYKPMPRKVPSQKELTEKKQTLYKDYTIAALGTEFKPNSRMRIAKEAIDDFGYEKFHHTNEEAVARRYISQPFNEYGITNDRSYWVDYSTYTPLPEDILNDWRIILREEHISEEEAANAFYRSEQGEDISQEKQYFKKAKQRFKEKYHIIPVLVKEWKCKN